MDEDVAGEEVEDCGFGDAGVGAAEPEDLGGLAGGEGGEEGGVGVGGCVGPFFVLVEGVGEGVCRGEGGSGLAGWVFGLGVVRSVWSTGWGVEGEGFCECWGWGVGEGSGGVIAEGLAKGGWQSVGDRATAHTLAGHDDVGGSREFPSGLWKKKFAISRID